jgi:hypothetical protein
MRYIAITVPKLSAACFAVGVVKPYMTWHLKNDTLSYFPSIMNYGLKCWGNTSYSSSISKIQKNIVRIIIGTGTRDSCRELFKMLNIYQFLGEVSYLLLLPQLIYCHNLYSKLYMYCSLYNLLSWGPNSSYGFLQNLYLK